MPVLPARTPGSKPEIVVGIDFGTTYSGFSFATRTGLQKIHLVTNWELGKEDFNNGTNTKVRTWITYKDQKATDFGYQAFVNPLKWFKILLQPDSYVSESKYLQEALTSLRKLGKSVDEVIADYLRWIWERGLKEMKHFHGSNFLDFYKIKVVLTVPAAWKPISKDRTMQAALAAGILGPINLVSEPEAAALSTLIGRHENDLLAVGDAVVICDAGGGTVDLISYQVNQIHPLRLKECAVGEGGLCGSVFLDLAFEELFQSKVGKNQYHKVKEKSKRRMIQQFEYQIKRNFDGDLKRNYTVELDGIGWANRNTPDSDEEDDEDDTILIKGVEVGKIFDDVCIKIDTLVRNQVKQISSRGLKISCILLIGGFGASSYLYSRLERIYLAQGIKVMKAEDAWSAVCRGATSWGLNNDAITSRIARYSYGQVVALPFDSDIHDYKDRFFDEAEDIWRAGNQMEYLIRKKDNLRVGAVLSEGYYEKVRETHLKNFGTHHFTSQLWYTDADRPPTRKEDYVQPLCEVEFEIECTKMLAHSVRRISPANKVAYRDIHFMLEIELGTTNLTMSVKFADETVAMCRSRYKEDFDD